MLSRAFSLTLLMTIPCWSTCSDRDSSSWARSTTNTTNSSSSSDSDHLSDPVIIENYAKEHTAIAKKLITDGLWPEKDLGMIIRKASLADNFDLVSHVINLQEDTANQFPPLTPELPLNRKPQEFYRIEGMCYPTNNVIAHIQDGTISEQLIPTILSYAIDKDDSVLQEFISNWESRKSKSSSSSSEKYYNIDSHHYWTSELIDKIKNKSFPQWLLPIILNEALNSDDVPLIKLLTDGV